MASYATASTTTASGIYSSVSWTVSGQASGLYGTSTVGRHLSAAASRRMSLSGWAAGRIDRGEECEIRLPDGSMLYVEASGNWRIDSADAQTLYRGNAELDFNRFLNASDILEDFIEFVGGMGVKQSELLALPVSAFIQFLIVRAAQEDGEEADMKGVVALLPSRPKKKRCACCGRFIKAVSRALFCSGDHAALAARRAFEAEQKKEG